MKPMGVRTNFGNGDHMKAMYGPDEASESGDVAEAILFAATREQPNTVRKIDLYDRVKFSGF
jgi:NADP-dependent 3-hydroxy acid dehydrogenase YdfG